VTVELRDFVPVVSGGLEVVAPELCEVVVRGTRECDVFDGLAVWVRRYYGDIEIIDLSRAEEWEPDPHGAVAGDVRPVYLVTVRFRMGAQLDHDWDADLGDKWAINHADRGDEHGDPDPT